MSNYSTYVIHLIMTLLLGHFYLIPHKLILTSYWLTHYNTIKSKNTDCSTTDPS